MTLPPVIAAEAALSRQNVALSMIKQSADVQKQVADILSQATEDVPVSSSRGSSVNIRV